MKLEFETHTDVVPKARLKGVIERAFPILCDYLKIAEIDATVRLSFYRECPDDGVAQHALGATRCDDPGSIKMQLKAGKPNIVVLSLSHEMVHVRQVVSGDMKIVKFADGTELDCMIFKGERYEAQALFKMRQEFILNDPAEKEAYASMEELYTMLMERLPAEDAEYVGAVPEWKMPKRKSLFQRLCDKMNGARDPLDAIKLTIKSQDIGARFEAIEKAGKTLAEISAAKLSDDCLQNGILLALAVARGGLSVVRTLTTQDDSVIDDGYLFAALLTTAAVTEKQTDPTTLCTEISLGPPRYAKALKQFRLLTGRDPAKVVVKGIIEVANGVKGEV